MSSSIKSRLSLAVDLAEHAFWEAISNEYGEAGSGDFLMETEWREMAERCVKHWVDLNVPENAPKHQSATLASVDIIMIYYEWWDQDRREWVLDQTYLCGNTTSEEDAIHYIHSKHPHGVKLGSVER